MKKIINRMQLYFKGPKGNFWPPVSIAQHSGCLGQQLKKSFLNFQIHLYFNFGYNFDIVHTDGQGQIKNEKSEDKKRLEIKE